MRKGEEKHKEENTKKRVEKAEAIRAAKLKRIERVRLKGKAS